MSRTYRLEKLSKDEAGHAFLTRCFPHCTWRLHYLGGNTEIPEVVAAQIARGQLDDSVFVVTDRRADISHDGRLHSFSLLRWVGGSVSIAHETAAELLALPRAADASSSSDPQHLAAVDSEVRP